ncbi:MAG TPA: hypothetical protein VL614_15135 [Acetobacteraceae bacterium]|jgi:hypothetical protein|nr:hypothetical protein [Acetobacteraceae bacterium]
MKAPPDYYGEGLRLFVGHPSCTNPELAAAIYAQIVERIADRLNRSHIDQVLYRSDIVDQVNRTMRDIERDRMA